MTPAEIVLVRHGETAWTISRQHTSRTDVPLTDRGLERAAALRERLADRRFAVVLTSPRRRAIDTCRAAGYPDATVDDDLVEWDYGDDEGRTTADIREERPGWTLWADGSPGGETAVEVTVRADRVIERLRAVDGDAAVFSHGHFLRVLAARWLGLDAAAGRLFALDPGSTSVLGWEREQPVLRSWNVSDESFA
jgi:probable phosphoglycerate mutase